MPKVRRLSCPADVVLFLCHLACSAMERVVLLCPNAFSEMESSYWLLHQVVEGQARNKALRTCASIRCRQ